MTVLDYTKHAYLGIPGHHVVVRGDFNKFTKSDKKVVFVPSSKSALNKVLKEYDEQAIANRSKQGWLRSMVSSNTWQI